MNPVIPRTLIVCTLFALGVAMAPGALAHDDDGNGGGCHSGTNDGVEDFCTALDEGVFEPLERLFPECTPSEQVSVGPLTVSLDSVCF